MLHFDSFHVPVKSFILASKRSPWSIQKAQLAVWPGREDRSRFSECIFVSTDGVMTQPKSVYRTLHFHKKKAMEITKNDCFLILTINDLQLKWNILLQLQHCELRRAISTEMLKLQFRSRNIQNPSFQLLSVGIGGFNMLLAINCFELRTASEIKIQG